MRTFILAILLAGCEAGNIHAYRDGTCRAYGEGTVSYNRWERANTVACTLTFEMTK